MVPGQLLQDSGGIVGGIVIQDNHLVIWIILCQQRGDAFADIVRLIAGRYQHRNEWIFPGRRVLVETLDRENIDDASNNAEQ